MKILNWVCMTGCALDVRTPNSCYPSSLPVAIRFCNVRIGANVTNRTDSGDAGGILRVRNAPHSGNGHEALTQERTDIRSLHFVSQSTKKS